MLRLVLSLCAARRGGVLFRAEGSGREYIVVKMFQPASFPSRARLCPMSRGAFVLVALRPVVEAYAKGRALTPCLSPLRPSRRGRLVSGDLNGTESFDEVTEVTDADVSFTCGCTDTPAPATDAPPIGDGTPSPASAPTTGAGDASGSVAARSLGSSTLAAATALVTAAAFALAMGG